MLVLFRATITKPPGGSGQKESGNTTNTTGRVRDIYLLLKSLLSPQLPSEFTFDEITSKLINHLKPRRLTVAERFKFHQRNQNDGKDVAKFAAELQLIQMLDDSPIKSGDIRNWTQRDPVLSRVQRYVLTGWPESDQTTQ